MFFNSNEPILLPDILHLNQKFASNFSSILELDELQNMIVKVSCQHINADKGFLIIFDKDPSEFHVKSFYNFEDQLINIKNLNYQIIYQYFSQLDKNESKYFNQVKNIENVHSLLVSKISIRENIIGYLFLLNKNQEIESDKFNDKNRYIVELISIHAASAIDKIKLYEKASYENEGIKKLQRYLPSKTISKVLQKNINLFMNGEQKVCTILIADIVGFNKLSDPLTPPQRISLLNEYFTVMTRVIFSFNGSISKFSGDRMTAVFGTPVVSQSHALESILTALEMKRQTESLKNKFIEKYKIDNFEIKMTINTGVVTYGNIGPIQRSDFSVIGNTVNITDKLLSHTKPNSIMITESCYERVKNIVKTRDSKKVILNEIDKIKIYEIYDKTDKEIFFETEKSIKSDYNIREHLRIPVKASATLVREGIKTNGILKDISLGGLSMKVFESYEIKDEVEISFKLNSELIFNNIKSIVQYVNVPKRKDKLDDSLLLGIKFLKLSDEDYIKLVNYIDRKYFTI